MKMKGGQIIKYVLSVGLAAVLVWLAVRSLDWEAFLQGLLQTRWGFVILFSAAAIAALLFRMLRWNTLLHPLDPGIRGLTVWDADNVSNLANVVLPGSGEFIRCGYVSSEKAPYGKVFGTIFLERLCDVLAVVILFILALCAEGDRFGSFFMTRIWEPVASRLNFSIWLILILCLLSAAAFIVAVFRIRGRSRFFARIAGIGSSLWQGFISFSRMERKWPFIIYTVGIWTMYVLMSYFILLAVPSLSGQGFTDALFISAVGNIASVVPVPGGIGAYHYLVALCLSSLYSAPWETGILYATLSHELHALIIILLGVISYARLTISRRK